MADCIAIFEASKKYDLPVFSSSSLRYGTQTQAARNGALGKITFCKTQSPASLEKTHPDLFWYGIHGVEALFTVMGTGCQSVQRTSEDGKIVVTGKWQGGRTGVFHEGKGYSGHAKGTEGDGPVGKYDGYRPLLVEVVKYFRTGEVPFSHEETIEICAFMEAADESKRRGGDEVRIAGVLEAARAKAALRLKQLDGGQP